MQAHLNIVIVFAAGLASVLSPCVLPVVPVVVTGGSNDHRLRPLLVVTGLASTFVLMGILSTLFGAIIGPGMVYAEKVAAVLIIIFGILFLFDINLFKYFSSLSNIGAASRGTWGGFFLGAVLGVIWIPCVGPILSSVLAIVAQDGRLGVGIGYLLVYSAGFSVPMLLAGYASQLFRSRIRPLQKHPLLLRWISGTILITLGAIILFKGMTGLGIW